VAKKVAGHDGSEILTVVVMKSSIFWDITPCSKVTVNSNESGSSACCLFRPDFLFNPFLDLEDDDDMFLEIVGWLSPDKTALYPR
jgi:hypothetical protein